MAQQRITFLSSPIFSSMKEDNYIPDRPLSRKNQFKHFALKSWRDYNPQPPGRPWSEFALGFTYLRRGYLFMREHPKLWRFALPSVILYLPVFFVFLSYFPSLVFQVSAALVEILIPVWGIWYGKLLIVAGLLFFVFPVVFLIVIILTSLVVLATLVASVFNDLLAEKTEELSRGRTDNIPFSLQRIMEEPLIVIKEEAKKLGFYFAVQAVFFLLSFIPVVGPVIYLTIGGMFTLLFLGFEYIDYPLARRLVPFGQKWNLMMRYIWRVFGFGTAVSLTLLIPVFNAFAIVFAVVGATLIFVDLRVYQEDEDLVPPTGGLLLKVRNTVSIARRIKIISLRRK